MFLNHAKERATWASEPGFARLQGHFYNWIAHYSGGTSLETLKPLFLERLLTEVTAWKAEPNAQPLDLKDRDRYYTALWLLSIALLLEIEDDLLAQLIRELDVSGQDALFDRLASSRIVGHPQAAELCFPEPFAQLIEALEQEHPLQQRNSVNHFLRKYYDCLKNTSFGELHLAQDQGFFWILVFRISRGCEAIRVR